MVKKKRKPTKAKKNIKFKIITYVIGAVVLLVVVTGLFVWTVYQGWWGSLPNEEELKNLRNDEASVIYSEDGELLGKYYVENRTNVKFDYIPTNAIRALVATEDARFYEHKGVDRFSLLRVLFKTFLLGDRSSGGGSTISQQLAKNLYPREEQDIQFMPVIKLKEMFTAYRLENIYTKDQILTLYLNTVSFGENAFGIESAAQQYFSSRASDLSITQAATLVGMLKAPSRYNPRLHPERAKQRRNTVINQMVKYDFLSESEGEVLKESEIDLEYRATNHYSGAAPWLRERIRLDAIKILDEYNQKHQTDYNLYRDGLILTTTIDASMQRYAEEAVKEHLKTLQNTFYKHLGKSEPWDKDKRILANAIKRSETYRALKAEGLSEKEITAAMSVKKPMMIYSAYQGEVRTEMSSIDSIKHYLKLLQPGLIAVEPSTGKVKAWVGGLNFKYFQYDQVTAPRQVGSVFKPVVYSAAIAHGARLGAYYKNEQKVYKDYDDWSPRNSNGNYDGFYTLKGALSQSINTIAVDVLMQTGIDTTITHARRLGISSELPLYPSLALGVADIPLNEMVNPYACFANDGLWVEQYYLSEIRDSRGTVLYKAAQAPSTTVLSVSQAHTMSNILSAVIDEGTGQHLRRVYGLTNEMAGKTGTTQNQVDGWFIGYNPAIVVGVRVGANDAGIHFNNTSLGQGASMALPIFGLFMQKCLGDSDYQRWSSLSFPVPSLSELHEQEIEPFKEKLNFIDKLSNRKVESVKATATEEENENIEEEKKPSFLRKIGNLFRKKEK